ncbi:hypothetical protein INS49_009238 [Diaporthe citri]|uniref:uncharacterized protein n=1 Tax=Diaporthe citri TaxID=83186 RepID=UPI001C811B38|nr:uncharacterized protein INS49_009238 [Diaporthe citri]KAG6361019.1 hypothetical protein INS49_009238 [Diaporthe citri]
MYFNSLVSQRIGKSIYGLPEKEQALHLFHELERFARTHYWLRVVTIESLHIAKLTQLLKTWLGDKFQVVFIDVEDSRRLGRSLVTVEALNRNDQMKRERGVELLTREADLVTDNNGTVEASMEALLRHAHVMGTATDGD